MIYQGMVTRRSSNKLGLAATPVAPRRVSKNQKTVSTHTAPRLPRIIKDFRALQELFHLDLIFSLLLQKSHVDMPQTRADIATVLSFTDSPHIQIERSTMMERNQIKNRIIFLDLKKKDLTPAIPSISAIFTCT